ncbi:MAG: hypothetical protein JO054_09740 [Actinobacteria bacterium]|nr:hypothetical protein [Actinomycetota bacterium]MBV9254501.1 hypothetical protein [Actinomycetota bacterium]
MVQSAFENSPEQAGETGVYRRADVEGFAEWARTTIDRLQKELAHARGRAATAEQRALTAEQALAGREALEDVVRAAVDNAVATAAESAATAASLRVETLLDDVRARVNARAHEEHADAPATPQSAATTPPVAQERHETDAEEGFDDPVRDPLPPWDERLLAFPDEQSELPPIGPIFGHDTHRSA